MISEEICSFARRKRKKNTCVCVCKRGREELCQSLTKLKDICTIALIFFALSPFTPCEKLEPCLTHIWMEKKVYSPISLRIHVRSSRLLLSIALFLYVEPVDPCRSSNDSVRKRIFLTRAQQRRHRGFAISQDTAARSVSDKRRYQSYGGATCGAQVFAR